MPEEKTAQIDYSTLTMPPAEDFPPLPFEFWVDELVDTWGVPREAAIDFVDGVDSWARVEMMSGR